MEIISDYKNFVGAAAPTVVNVAPPLPALWSGTEPAVARSFNSFRVLVRDRGLRDPVFLHEQDCTSGLRRTASIVGENVPPCGRGSRK